MPQILSVVGTSSRIPEEESAHNYYESIPPSLRSFPHSSKSFRPWCRATSLLRRTISRWEEISRRLSRWNYQSASNILLCTPLVRVCTVESAVGRTSKVFLIRKLRKPWYSSGRFSKKISLTSVGHPPLGTSSWWGQRRDWAMPSFCSKQIHAAAFSRSKISPRLQQCRSRAPQICRFWERWELTRRTTSSCAFSGTRIPLPKLRWR